MGPILRWAFVLTTLAIWGWYLAGKPNIVAKVLSQFEGTDKAVQESERSSEKSKISRRSKAKKSSAAELENKSPLLANDDAAATVPKVSSVKSGAAKKRKIQASPVEVQKSDLKSKDSSGADNAAAVEVEQEGDMDNKEFAKQFAQVRSGTSLKSNKDNETSKKERRARKQAMRAADGSSELSGSPFASTETSSMTGIEGDDDVSPLMSSPLDDVSNVGSLNGGGVADMLEAKASGPTSLRLKMGPPPAYQAPKKPVAQYQAVETKKQRQNRRKAEATKAMVEESNREHNLKKEQQMRAARLAEGSSAQTRASSFKPPTHNAWFPNNDRQPSTQSVDAPTTSSRVLLDTFDPTEYSVPPTVSKAEEPESPSQSLGEQISSSAPTTNTQGSHPQESKETMPRTLPITEQEHDDLQPDFLRATVDTDSPVKRTRNDPPADDMNVTPKKPSVKDNFSVSNSNVAEEAYLAAQAAAGARGSRTHSEAGSTGSTAGPGLSGGPRSEEGLATRREIYTAKKPPTSVNIDWATKQKSHVPNKPVTTATKTEDEMHWGGKIGFEPGWETVPPRKGKKNADNTRQHKKSNSEHDPRLHPDQKI